MMMRRRCLPNRVEELLDIAWKYSSLSYNNNEIFPNFNADTVNNEVTLFMHPIGFKFIVSFLQLR